MEAKGSSDPTAPEGVLARLDALETEVARLARGGDAAELDAAPSEAAGPDAAEPARAAATEDPFWALHGLQDRIDEGGVVFAGSLEAGREGGRYEFQWGRPTEHLVGLDWSEAADSLSALGHPVRLAILQRLVGADAAVRDLVDDLGLGSTGVAYHHLHQLTAAGWVRSARPGRYEISAARVIPLLTILTAWDAR